MTASGVPSRIDVILPAHDEEELIGASLTALTVAREQLVTIRPDVEVGIVVVLDACTDGTADIVSRWVAETVAGVARTDVSRTDVSVVEIAERNVGAARRAGVDGVDGVATRIGPEQRWIATTDADSRVDPEWLVAHADALFAGIDVLLGTVRPEATDLDEAGRRHWEETHPPGHLPGNVHGANLGVRLDAYRRIGGFAALAEHEDVDLVARARRAGLDVRATLDAPVITSGRREGRTPGGYAAFLADAYGPHPTRA